MKPTHSTQRNNTKVKKALKNSHTKENETSWGGVASWYNTHLDNNDTYHKQVVFPHLLRLLGDIESKHVLDLACGQGQFTQELYAKKAHVTGVDIGKELIKIAEDTAKKQKRNITYFVSSADDLFMIKDGSQEVVVCVLALQNIEHLQKTIKEIGRVLQSGGNFYCVINHPSFRIPRASRWHYNESENIQERILSAYMSESHTKIDMTPGADKNKKFTVSFHRPLQVYIKALRGAGLYVHTIEEWVSHKESESGPRKHAEDVSRREFPMFMCIGATKVT